MENARQNARRPADLRCERERWFHLRCRTDLGDRLGSRRSSVLAGQREHRKLPCGPGLVFTKSGILGDQLRPQLGAGGAGQLVRQDRERLGTHLNGDLWLALRL